ncbi:MAG TPA: hypothetical protein VLK26_00965 [Rudaea sp.]|nr:hypothetical protein [Rudaea sp.]
MENPRSAGLFAAGAIQRVARSTPSRAKIASASAWATAPLTVLSLPQLYSVIASFVPGQYWAIHARTRGIRSGLL